MQQHWKGDVIVVMDADGEDRPEVIPVLSNSGVGGTLLVIVSSAHVKL